VFFSARSLANGGIDLVFVGIFFVFRRIVGRKLGDFRAELLQDRARFIQLPPADIRLAIRPAHLLDITNCHSQILKIFLSRFGSVICREF